MNIRIKTLRVLRPGIPKLETLKVFCLGILVFNSNRLVAQIPEIISFPQINAGSREYLAYIPFNFTHLMSQGRLRLPSLNFQYFRYPPKA